MAEEKFDYKEFTKKIYEQFLSLMPDDIEEADKEYLATTIKQFAQTAAEGITNKYKGPHANIIMFISQVVAEWTFHKGLDIIRAGIPKNLRQSILQDIAFIAYQTLNNNINRGTNQEKLLIDVEDAVKKGFKKIIENLYLNNIISKEITLKTIKLSNIDSVINAADKPINIEQEKDFFEFDNEGRDLIEHYAAQEEYIPTEQEKNQMNEYRRNYFDNIKKL